MAAAETTTQLAALLGAFFCAVSFEPGGAPDYGAIDALFAEGGRLIKNSEPVPEISTVAQFAAARQPLVDSGALTEFEELETSEITEVFGNVAHRFSGYSKRGTLDGTPFAGRGVIATQFIRTPAGWRISSMAWDDERDGLTIPPRYEPAAGASRG